MELRGREGNTKVHSQYKKLDYILKNSYNGCTSSKKFLYSFRDLLLLDFFVLSGNFINIMKILRTISD